MRDNRCGPRRVERCVITLRQGRRDAPPQWRGAPWSVITAAVLTGGLFAGVLRSVRQPSWANVDASLVRPPAPDYVVLTKPHEVPEPPSARRTVPASTSAPAMAPRARPADISNARPLPDTASTRIAPTNATTEESLSPLSPPSMSSRLVPTRQGGLPWYSLPRPRDPFAGSSTSSAAEQDSILREMAGQIADLAARRVQPQSERDAAAKEAMLKMRLLGRTLLVPPDNTGGLITASIPLPFLSSGPSKARRARDARVFDENKARLERLRQRADSSRRSRGDSVPD
jgi:hypothetical protein